MSVVCFIRAMRKVIQKNERQKADWKQLIDSNAPLHVRYPEGELIYQVGTYAAGVYLITRGFVSDHCTTQKKDRYLSTSEILGPGELIGLAILLQGSDKLHISRARAITETELCFFEKESFFKMAQEQTIVKDYCIDCLARRLYSIKRRSCPTDHKTPAEQMYQLLLELAQKHGEYSEKGLILLPTEITEAVLAQLLGISNTKLSRIITSVTWVSLLGERLALLPEASPLS